MPGAREGAIPRSISQELDDVFQRASLSYLRNTLKFDRDLAEFETISRTADEKREELTRLYHEEYETRFNAERGHLYDKASHWNLDHPPPPGGGGSRAEAINREAHRLVRHAHEADLKRVRDEAQQSLEDLLDRAHRRNQAHGMAREAFRYASDRRSGADRRRPGQSYD